MNTLRAITVLAVLAASAAAASAATINVPGDWPRIQTAIDQSFPGDTVLVAAGTYAESLFLDQVNNLTIKASGVVILTPPGTGKNARPGLTLFSCQNITFDGFTVSKSKTDGIRVTTSLNCSVLHCIVDGAKGSGINVYGGSDITVADCTVTKTGAKRVAIGVDLAVGPPSVRCHVQRCTVTKSGGAGINVHGTFGLVEDCVVTGTKKAGIELDRSGGNDGGIVRRCTVTGAGDTGIAASGPTVVIDHNTVNGAAQYGIAVVQDTSGGTASPVIDDNVVTKTKKKDGILAGVAGANVDRNTVTSAHGDGIRVAESGTELRDNIVTKSGAIGVHLLGSGHDVTGNNASANKKADLWDQSTGTTFTSNTFVKVKL